MFIYAGIDEAGYGPILGPLVISSATFIIENPDYPRDPPGSLWELLKDAVCKRISDEAKRIPVNDSKFLYSAAIGLGHLERAVLSFLHTLGFDPKTVDEILKLLAYDDLSAGNGLEWYTDPAGGPALPAGCTPELLAASRDSLGECFVKQGIRLAGVKSAVVFEDRFNRLLLEHENKAKASWTFVAGHLRNIWNTYGDRRPYVVIDRQGGRRYYEEVLAAYFPRAVIGIVEENNMFTRYRILSGKRRMDVTLQTAGEQFHLPVALASMTAKYVRELLMMRFKRFWREKAPDVRPTSGYFVDGRRFTEEIEPVRALLGIDKSLFIRER